MIIYDLDDTLLPTRSIPETTFAPVFDAITQANDGLLPAAELELAFAELWRKPMDTVALAYNFSAQMIDAGKHALINTDYRLVLSPYDDVEAIKQLPGKRILVTTGITKLQQAKIDALFQPGDFDETVIDDPYQQNRLGKQRIFALLAEAYQLKPEQIWVVGDNPESEIAAGNALGMQTVQVLRPGVVLSTEAKFVITSLLELRDLVGRIG